jgi:nicotinate phosphoribosyltransferase
MGLGELAAFRAYAELYPDECVLLVDTVDTLKSGVPNAIIVFRELEAQGHRPGGIRLDSGDLAYLAIQAARLLDDAGFPEARIVVSSELDELAMWQILAQIDDEAPRYRVDPERLVRRLTFGVGTRLISSHGHSALGGVYKLVAIEGDDGWIPAIKISDSPEKMGMPGPKQVWRVYDNRGLATADVVATASEAMPADRPLVLYHPHRHGVSRTLEVDEMGAVEPLLTPAGGPGDGSAVDLSGMRQRRVLDLERLDPGVRRLVNPHVYHVSVTENMKALQERLVAESKADRAST